MIEAARFWAAHDTQGDGMGFWLTTPLVWHESPREVVLRMLGAAAAERAERVPRDGHLVVAGHSGCLRALVTWAVDADPTEPDNAEEVVLALGHPNASVQIAYGGHSWTMPLPQQIEQRPRLR